MPSKGEPSAPTPAAISALAMPSAAMMLAPLTIPQLLAMTSMGTDGSTKLLLPSSVDELDLQVRALLSGYAARRALLLGGRQCHPVGCSAIVSSRPRKPNTTIGNSPMRNSQWGIY